MPEESMETYVSTYVSFKREEKKHIHTTLIGAKQKHVPWIIDFWLG